MKRYQVGLRQAVKVDKTYYKPGEMIAEDCSEAAVQAGLKAGLLFVVEPDLPAAPVLLSPPASQPVSSKWIINPALLHAKDLNQLNVMIRERDPSIQPFETREEAIAFISQDYKPPTDG